MNKHGFTLLEVLLAISMLAVVVTMLSFSLGGSMRVFEATEGDEVIYTMAQTAMERMVEDLSSAFVVKGCALNGETQLVNGYRADRVELCSFAHIVFNPSKQKRGLARIGYRLEQSETDEEAYKLLRSDQLLIPLQDDRAAVTAPGFIIADNLRSLQLTYFNAEGQEFDNWQGETDEPLAPNQTSQDPAMQLPAAIHCILEFWADEQHSSTIIFSARAVLPVGANGGQ
nr:prepilin-type N-terminal cleavage/methylation domain-containing protein [uncultured Desulfobulbus sp.]